MNGSRRTLLTAFAGLAAAAMPRPFGGRRQRAAAARRSNSAAPNFVGISQWFNSAPLSIGDLRGKVVLVDFWTYGCYNCVNTLPYVTKLYETYKDKGLVVVGVHTPEFPFERSAANVQAALKRHGINYPVARTTTPPPGTPGATDIGRLNTSSTRTARSCSATPAKANMTRSSAPCVGC